MMLLVSESQLFDINGNVTSCMLNAHSCSALVSHTNTNAMHAITTFPSSAVVSVHGGLSALPNITAADDPTTLPKLLVLSGGEDDTSTAIMDLEMTLNETGVEWEITRYSGIEHAWTVFGGDAYNEWADQR
jgi:acetyl esterase/lipase